MMDERGRRGHLESFDAPSKLIHSSVYGRDGWKLFRPFCFKCQHDTVILLFASLGQSLMRAALLVHCHALLMRYLCTNSAFHQLSVFTTYPMMKAA